MKSCAVQQPVLERAAVWLFVLGITSSLCEYLRLFRGMMRILTFSSCFLFLATQVVFWKDPSSKGWGDVRQTETRWCLPHQGEWECSGGLLPLSQVSNALEQLCVVIRPSTVHLDCEVIVNAEEQESSSRCPVAFLFFQWYLFIPSQIEQLCALWFIMSWQGWAMTHWCLADVVPGLVCWFVYGSHSSLQPWNVYLFSALLLHLTPCKFCLLSG